MYKKLEKFWAACEKHCRQSKEFWSEDNASHRDTAVQVCIYGLISTVIVWAVEHYL